MSEQLDKDLIKVADSFEPRTGSAADRLRVMAQMMERGEIIKSVEFYACLGILMTREAGRLEKEAFDPG